MPDLSTVAAIAPVLIVWVVLAVALWGGSDLVVRKWDAWRKRGAL